MSARRAVPGPTTPTAEPDRVRVVYILGAGRSGTTVLGILLGNLPDVFYAGELEAWNRLEGVPVTERADVMAFWEAVAERVPDRAAHHRRDYRRYLEHHWALFRPRGWTDGELRRQHAALTAAVLRAIREVSSSSIIVDSSHFPLRAWRLSRMPEVDLRVVHMVRDPRQVVSALQNPEQRHVPMHPAQANLYCLAVAALSRVVLLTIPRARRVTLRHEDLVADPGGELRRLAGFLGRDPSGVRVDDLEVGPLFVGNRLRRQRRLAIVDRPPGPSPLSRAWRGITFVAQLPLLVGYGYLPRRSPPPSPDPPTPGRPVDGGVPAHQSGFHRSAPRRRTSRPAFRRAVRSRRRTPV